MTARPPVPLKQFRLLPGDEVIDLPFRPPPHSQIRVSTMWPDSSTASGWASRVWPLGPNNRGWVPDSIYLGDVVGFVATPDVAAPPQLARRPFSRTARTPDAGPHTARLWYGYLHDFTPTSMTLRGPYPDPPAAYAAAQQFLQAAMRGDLQAPGPAWSPTPGPAPPVELAQPPVAVTVSWHGATATVGDPHHGWIHVAAEPLGAALAHNPAHLAELLAGHVELADNEAAITLAALAARHIPEHLIDVTARPVAAVPLDAPDVHAPDTSDRPEPPAAPAADPTPSSEPVDPPGL